MKRINTLLLLAFINTATAQQKKIFFDHVYFSAMGGTEVYQVDRSEWKNMYADRPTIPYFLDTMQLSFIRKDGFFFVSPDGTAAIAAGKTLFKNNTGRFLHKRELEWKTSFHFKTIYYSPNQDGFTNDPRYPYDTTKVTSIDRVRLEQRKKIIDWQNSILFKTRYLFNNKMRFIIGNGIGIGTTVSNTIKDSYGNITYTWNTTAHQFDEKQSPLASNSYKAKPDLYLSYIFYLGTEYKLSKNVSLITDGYYSIAHFKYSASSKKTEGYWLGLTFCYSLNQ
jgi:hypothetical protein